MRKVAKKSFNKLAEDHGTQKRAVLVLVVLSAVLAGVSFASSRTTEPVRSVATVKPVAKPVAKPKKPVESIQPKVTPGEVIRDITYCDGQLLDIYQPTNVMYLKSPVVMYVHGGGWTLNDKASEPDQLQMIDGLRAHGFVVASINYGKVPQRFYPTAVAETLCAVRFLRAKAVDYSLDKNKIALYGFSAGGYLAAMAGTVPDDSSFETEEYKDYSSRVQAVVTLAGLFDFDEGLNAGNRQRITNFMNGTSIANAQPVEYVSSDDPSFMLVHGVDDQYVPLQQDDLLIAKLNEHGVYNERLLVHHAEHGLNSTGLPPAPSRVEVANSMQKFIRETLKR